MLQYITQTLQRAICTNPVNTIAIELQTMIMPYWYWLNCYMPSLMVIWLELYTTTAMSLFRMLWNSKSPPLNTVTILVNSPIFLSGNGYCSSCECSFERNLFLVNIILNLTSKWVAKYLAYVTSTALAECIVIISLADDRWVTFR
jgi:hypothetical protein